MREITRRWFPVLASLLAVLSLAGLIIVPAASAMDGRVTDARSTDPVGEITAYYWHGLNRDPDSGGLANYMSFANQDCRWGLQDAGIKILDSGEAHNVWRNDPQTLAGMLYAALLNRPPDPGGLATYTAAIQARGLRWSITAMQSSDEFHTRLDRICAGRKSSNATVWNPHDAVVQAIRINNGASTLVAGCGVAFLINTFAPIKALAGAPRIIRLGKLAAGQAIKVAGGDCYAAYQMLSAADNTASLADYGGANNPVFVEQDTRTYWNFIGHWCETWIRVGPNAMTWSGYKADYRCILV